MMRSSSKPKTEQGVVHVSHVEEVGATPRVSVQLTAAMNTHAAYHNGRRASGGSATSILGIPMRDQEGRRSSLGPTVMPETVRAKKRSSSESKWLTLPLSTC